MGRRKKGASPEGDSAPILEQLAGPLDSKFNPETPSEQPCEETERNTADEQILFDFAAVAFEIDIKLREIARRRIDAAMTAIIKLAQAEADVLYLDAARHPAADTRPVDGIMLSERQNAVLAALAIRALGEPFRLAGGGEDLDKLIQSAFADRIAVLTRSPSLGGRA